MQYMLIARLRRGRVGLVLLFFSLRLMIKGESITLEWDVISLGLIHVSFPVLVDGMAAIFSAVVLLIAGRVLMFSLGYS